VTENDQVKAALAALAEGESRDAAPAQSNDSPTKRTMSDLAAPRVEYRRIIDRASAATDDIELAAEFVDSTGLDRLHDAVERAEQEVSGAAAEGREALEAFERFRLAAKGQREG